MSDMTMKALRQVLASKNASWSIARDAADATTLEELGKRYMLGSLPPPPNMPTTRMPRIRPPLKSPVVPANPEINRVLRGTLTPAVGALPRAIGR